MVLESRGNFVLHCIFIHMPIGRQRNVWRNLCEAINWKWATCLSGAGNEESEEGIGWSSYVYRWTSFTWWNGLRKQTEWQRAHFQLWVHNNLTLHCCKVAAFFIVSCNGRKLPSSCNTKLKLVTNWCAGISQSYMYFVRCRIFHGTVPSPRALVQFKFVLQSNPSKYIWQ